MLKSFQIMFVKIAELTGIKIKKKQTYLRKEKKIVKFFLLFLIMSLFIICHINKSNFNNVFY